jgi:CBS domain-containing protein
MLTAADVMTTDVVSIDPDRPIQEIAELLYSRGISGVPVVEDGRVVGVVSEGDLIGHAAAIGEQRGSWWLTLFRDETASARDYAKTHGRVARDVMTRDVITIEESATLGDIARLLDKHHIKRVPVLRDGRLVGVVSRRNLLRGLANLAAPPSVASPDDAAMRRQLVAELRRLSWAHIAEEDVAVENGVVRLSGLVHSEDERRAIRIATENVPGVRAVEDDMMLRTTPPI